MQTLINKEEYSKVIIIEITREKTKVKHISRNSHHNKILTDHMETSETLLLLGHSEYRDIVVMRTWNHSSIGHVYSTHTSPGYHIE